MRTLAIAAMAFLVSAPSHAEDINSGNYLLPGCKAFVDSTNKASRFDQGACAGTVKSMLIVGTAWDRWCPPDKVTTGQAMKVVIAFLEKRPERLHESYITLIAEAISGAWPCKEKSSR